MRTYTTDDMIQVLAELRPRRLIVNGTYTTRCVAGMPPGDKDLRAFIEHQMKIDPATSPEQFEAAFRRIRNEEIETTPDLGEVKEIKVYGVAVHRKDEKGPFLLGHLFKAAAKVAASRLKLFIAHPGMKGDLAEMSSVVANGDSLRDPKHPEKIYVRHNGGPASVSFETFSGNVSGPQGKRSITSEREVLPAGSTFSIRLEMFGNLLSLDDAVKIVAGMQTCGIGSCRSFDLGHFAAEVVVEDEAAWKHAATNAKKRGGRIRFNGIT